MKRVAPAGAAEAPHRVHRRGVEAHRPPRAARAPDRRPRAVRGELQGGRTGRQALAPVAQQLLQAVALQTPALPDGVVGVLDGELGQGRRPGLDAGRVELPELADEQAERPARRRRCDGRSGAAGGSPARGAAGRRGAGGRARDRRGGGLRGGPAGYLSLLRRRREGAQVDAGHEGDRGELRRRERDLERLPPGEDEARAQRLVPAHDLARGSRRAPPGRGAPRSRAPPADAGTRRRARSAPGTRAAAARRTGPAARSRETRTTGSRSGPGAAPSARPGRPGPRRSAPRRPPAAAAPPRTPRAPATPAGSPAANGRPGRRSPPPPTAAPAVSAQHLGEDPRDPAPRPACAAPPPVLRGRSGCRRASALRSTLPLAVRGRAGRNTQADGTMNSGSRWRRKSRSSDGSGATVCVGHGHHVRHQPVPPGLLPLRQHHRLAHPRVGRRAASISPGSTRKPRTLTCASIRPRNSRSPVRPPAHQVAGPVQAPARLPPRTGPARSAPPSGPAGPDSRAPARPRPCTARRPLPPAPARVRGPARTTQVLAIGRPSGTEGSSSAAARTG